MRALGVPWLGWSLLAALAVLQVLWTQGTIGLRGWNEGSVAYHHAPAFAAYFFAGCLIGQWRRAAFSAWPAAAAVAACATLAGVLLAWMPLRAGEELLGLRGLLLPLACMVTVFVCGQAKLEGYAAKAAAWLGDITYGSYLLHPILLFGLLWFVLPEPVQALSIAARLGVLAGVLVASCLLAAASERWLERPFRRRGRALLASRSARPQSEAASISS